MEQNYQYPTAMTDSSQVPPMVRGWMYPPHREPPGGDAPRPPKRQRQEPNLQPLPAGTLNVSEGATASLCLQDTNGPRHIQHLDPHSNGVHSIGQDLSFSPQSYPPRFRDHLAVNGAYAPRPSPRRFRKRGVSSTTHGTTSFTLSPRSSIRSFAADLRNSASPSQGVPSDGFSPGSFDFDLEFALNLGWTPGDSNGDPLLFNSTNFGNLTTINDAVSAFIEAPIVTQAAEAPYREDLISLTQETSIRVTPRSEEPWSFPPSFSHVNTNTSGVEPSQTAPVASRVSHADTRGISKSLQLIKPSETIETPDLIWSYNTVCPKTQQPLSDKRSSRELGYRPGVRKGPLKPEKAKRISEIRNVRSCFSCKISKLSCSLGEICERCQMRALPGVRTCFRKRLKSWIPEFSPDLVVDRFRRIDLTIRENTERFTNNIMEIEMSSGPEYPPFKVMACEFVPSNSGLRTGILSLQYVASKNSTNERGHKFTSSFAPPLGLCDPDSENLRGECSAHINSIIKQERHVEEATRGDTSMLSWEVSEAINHFRKSCPRNQQTTLLRKALMLHAGFYFMSRIILFTEDSAEKAVSQLRSPSIAPFGPVLTSTIVSLQIKKVMQQILVELSSTVLEGLEEALLSKEKSEWANCFCIVSILCICIESVQVASDGYAVAALRKGSKPPKSREGLCQDLDIGFYMHITEMFHEAFKTRKKFNPIKRGLFVDEKKGITPQMVHLVKEIQGITWKHKDDIAERVKDPIFNSEPDLLTHHMAFRKRNSGRLLSKFLGTFLEHT